MFLETPLLQRYNCYFFAKILAIKLVLSAVVCVYIFSKLSLIVKVLLVTHLHSATIVISPKNSHWPCSAESPLTKQSLNFNVGSNSKNQSRSITIKRTSDCLVNKSSAEHSHWMHPARQVVVEPLSSNRKLSFGWIQKKVPMTSYCYLAAQPLPDALDVPNLKQGCGPSVKVILQ